MAGDFGSLFDSIGSGVSDVASGIGNAVSSGVQGVEGLFGGGADPAMAGAGAIPGAAAPITGAATSAAPLVGSAGADALSAIPTDASGAIPGASPSVALTAPLGSDVVGPDPNAIATDPSTITAGASGVSPVAPQPSFLDQVLHPGSGATGGGGGGWGKFAIPGALLAGTIYEGTRPPPGMGDMTALANQEKGLAAQFAPQVEGELSQGIIPAPAQAALDQALRDAKSSIKSKYASMGMAGSTAEAQDLQAADQNAVAERFKIATELAQQGISVLNGADTGEASLYQAIMAAETQQGSALGQSLAAFAGALAR